MPEGFLVGDDLLHVGEDVARDAHVVGGPTYALELLGGEGPSDEHIRKVS
ncbi:MAG: hypothetical protein ACRDY7_01695 [Acidimicrobiia bacterium]